MYDLSKTVITLLVCVQCIDLIIAANTGSEIPEVQITNGHITGVYKTSRNGRHFASFTRIPYAKPPIGELRFKAPVPAESWKTTLNAVEEVPKCLQKDYVSFTKPEVEGSEDCLYLNVYTPKSALTTTTTSTKKLLPVMVFIHWGGNIAGSSKSTILGPEYLMDRQVLLVTFNYRLGIFGFFSTLNDDAPGNWAAKDQVLALKWVQENIASFGGDRNQVTIFGQSAGAGAVHHLILSPSAKGLFHRGISESGAALCLWAKPFNAVQQMIYKATAQSVGCDSTDTAALVKCLRGVDSNVLVSVADAFKYFFREPLIPYTYVTETKSENNPEPFLTRDPQEIIASGDFNRVPWILGVVQNEGALKTAPFLIDSTTREQLLEKFDVLMPKNLLLEASVPNDTLVEFWTRTKEFYLEDDNVYLEKPNTVHGFTNMYSDRSFTYGAYQSALYHSQQGHGPIWFYNFNYRGSHSYANSVFLQDSENTLDFDFGVSHCDELLYIFKSPELFPDFTLNATELLMSKIMISLWTNFAQTGNPHKQWQPLPNLTGRKATNKDLFYLNIRGPHKLELRNDYRTKFMKFWIDAPLVENIDGIE